MFFYYTQNIKEDVMPGPLRVKHLALGDEFIYVDDVGGEDEISVYEVDIKILEGKKVLAYLIYQSPRHYNIIPFSEEQLEKEVYLLNRRNTIDYGVRVKKLE